MAFILTKFFSKKEYRDDFINGRLYFSSLSEFTKVVDEGRLIEEAKRGNVFAKQELEKLNNKSQRDIYEGAIASISPKDLTELEADMRDVMCSDVYIKPTGYDYCNIMSFCRMQYNKKHIKTKEFIEWFEPNMSDFGNYVIIIKNPDEFVRRIDYAMKKRNYKYICGNVEYHPITLNGAVATPKNSVVLEAAVDLNVESVLQRCSIKNYDIFNKCDYYEFQNEWRIVVDDNCTNKEPLKLNIGDLSDIVQSVDLLEFSKELLNGIMNCKYELFSLMDYGNITRVDMKAMFYDKGNNKGRLISMIG